jgi:TonB family protein
MEPVPPDTIGDTVMKFVCSWKPTTQTGDPPSQNGDLHLSDVGKLTPAQGIVTIRMPDCRKDYYPSQALRLQQEGSVVVKLCVGPDNKIDGPVEVLTSSGFPALDEAASQCVRAGRYEAGIVSGQPARTCKPVLVNFTLLERR